MKDKNGVEIKVGDRILSKGRFEYEIRLKDDFLIARGKSLKHTDRLDRLDLSQVEILK